MWFTQRDRPGANSVQADWSCAMTFRRLFICAAMLLGGSVVGLTRSVATAKAAAAAKEAPANVTGPPNQGEPIRMVTPPPASGRPITPVVVPANGKPFHTGDPEPIVLPPSFAADDVDVNVDAAGGKNKAGASPVSFQKHSNKAGTPSSGADSPGKVRFRSATTDEVGAALWLTPGQGWCICVWVESFAGFGAAS
jgi:hypothetical protein